MPGQTKPILDTKTGKEYSSMYAAGKELGKKLVPDYTGADRLIWFSMVRAFPDRFQTKSTSGEWVALNDPSVPKITRVRRTETDEQKEQRLLAELGEISARKSAAKSGTASTGTATNTAAAGSAASNAAVNEAAEEEVEVADEAASSPTPGKKKLAGAVKA